MFFFKQFCAWFAELQSKLYTTQHSESLQSLKNVSIP